MTSRTDRYEAALYADALRAEHEAALATAVATCACSRCAGEGVVGAGYEDARPCTACHGTGSLVAEEAPEHGDADLGAACAELSYTQPLDSDRWDRAQVMERAKRTAWRGAA